MSLAGIVRNSCFGNLLFDLDRACHRELPDKVVAVAACQVAET